MAHKERSRRKKEASETKKPRARRSARAYDFEEDESRWGISDMTRNSIFAILFFVVGIFFSAAPFNEAGRLGTSLHEILGYLLGVGYFVLPALFFLLGISFFRATRPNLAIAAGVGAFLFLASSLGLVSIFSGDASGGLLGTLIATPLVYLFKDLVASLFLVAFLVISLLVMFDTHLKLSTLLFWRKRADEDGEEEDDEEEELEEEEYEEGDEEELEMEPVAVSEEAPEKPAKLKGVLASITEKKKGDAEDFSLAPLSGGSYTPPPLSYLATDNGKPSAGDIKANAQVIKRTLAQHGITVEMDEVSIGPAVTRYALKPAEGVKLSRILGLQNELSYALAAHPLRIEAPIPGQSLVGIEVPNSTKTMVGLGTLFASEEFVKSPKSLLLALGRGVSGKLHYGDLAKMPHVLIAGTTGSGKSVTIHTIINSLLYRNGPDHVRFIMVDPKRVELTLYNKIPHLLTPVITDAKKAILALKWAAKEMDRRYNILEENAVRDIGSYHKTIYEPALKAAEKAKKKKGDEEEPETLPEHMPYIVCIIDELADIMQTYPRELESAIVRLAQMSRAVGIHLILSTQRPSVNVITGLIKANIPSRIALQVASQVDSKTILDQAGAEKLLGQGDMLYISGEMSKPTRVQSAFMSEAEVKAVAKYLAGLASDSLPDEITFSQGSSVSNERDPLFASSFDDEGDEDEEEDELYEDARMIVIEAGKASTSYLQRRLKVGYSRAARLIDMLEERSVIGPADGAKPREVLEKAGTETDDEE